MSVARHRSLILVVIGTTLLGLMAEWLAWGQRQATVTPTTEMVLVTRMVDGDTLALNTGEKVRLIGMDTPEMKHPKRPVEAFGKEATAFTKPMVEGKCVRLEYDQQRQDKYGRILAYVQLDDGTFVNAEVIKQGYGFAYTQFLFKYLEHLRTLQREGP